MHLQPSSRQQELMALARELGDARGLASSLNNLSIVVFARGDDERATSLCRESLVLVRGVGDNVLAVESVETLGKRMNSLSSANDRRRWAWA